MCSSGSLHTRCQTISRGHSTHNQKPRDQVQGHGLWACGPLAKSSLQTWLVWSEVMYKHLNLGRFHTKNYPHFYLLWVNGRFNNTDPTFLNSHHGLEVNCASYGQRPEPRNLISSLQGLFNTSLLVLDLDTAMAQNAENSERQTRMMNLLSHFLSLPHCLPWARYCCRNLWWEDSKENRKIIMSTPTELIF